MNSPRLHVVTRCCAIVFASAVFATSGCSTPRWTANPSFSIDRESARADLARMASAPVPAQRPILVLAGIGDLRISSGALVRGIAPTLEGQLIEIDFFSVSTFADARQALLREAAAALGTSLEKIPEVDVIAFSMGGLVARDAAIVDSAGRQLRIRRLFTIATPHQGARLAGIPMGIPVGEDMCPTSDFIERFRRTRFDYQLICYTRLDDITVGEENAAPEGVPLWWVPTPSGEWSHMAAFDDPRIQADIARRLRGETPWTTSPATPLPN
ncbi:MAG: hypothetical protein DWI12_06275 [Planctomycetota bacterium]|nr:MAG: hypothetical protein DWI12_06275 [Planctomycetota bacterium]